MQADATHDPARRSWVESANSPQADFPIQNLPFGVFSEGGGWRRVGVAIGDAILDLTALEQEGLISPDKEIFVFDQGVLNPFMALGASAWTATRHAIADLLDAANPVQDAVRAALVPQADVQMHLPFFVRSYTDFYASKEHATNVGMMFRDRENALLPNWLHIPIGYNGRASTVVVSGTDVHRPNGQVKAPDQDAPEFGPCRKLDYELELGAVVGTPSTMGQPLDTTAADDAIFGYVLLNDWSARDVQVWEYQPLGPFQAKAFATSISPWVVTRDALVPFRVPTPAREKPLLPYLAETRPNNIDLELKVTLTPEGGAPTQICRTNAKGLYYSAAQQLAHHTSSGCAMAVGDLIGSGTISGETPDSVGSLLEASWNGQSPVQIAGGTRCFLEDGDTLTITGACEGPYRVGFGECAGKVLPAVPFP